MTKGQYDVEINGRRRLVTLRRVEGRFAVILDGREWAVDAARVDAQTLSLLTAEPGDPGAAGPAGATRHAGATVSHEVSFVPDPATGGLIVRVGEASLPVTVGGRRSGRRGAAGTGTAVAGPQRIVAPMPGRIARVLVKQGETVRARQALVVIEAMKMENELRAQGDGTLAEIHVQDGQLVEAGALLAIVHR